MSVVVISNAGLLMVLAKLNLLHLLKALYGDVRFTRAVYDEVVVEGMRRGHEDASTAHRFLTHEGWLPGLTEAVVVGARPFAEGSWPRSIRGWPLGLTEAVGDRGQHKQWTI